MYHITRLLLIRRGGCFLCFSKRYLSTSSTRQPFRYAPLDLKRNEIRLLTVLPPKHPDFQELHCSLTHSSLDSQQEYHALSYAWTDGDLYPSEETLAYPEKCPYILVNDGRLRVGHNLAAALRARRSHEYRNVPIWVDAISINQDEITERSGQILRMRGIYARASKVTVWLGPESKDSQKAFQFIEMLHNRSKMFEGWVKDPSTGGWIKESSGFATWFQESLLRRRYSHEWQAVYQLLRRAWWKRIWIVQEMVAAKNVVLFCGDQTLEPIHLSGFFDLLVAHGIMYLPLLSKLEGIVLEYDTFSLARAYLRQETWKGVSLLQALYRTGMSLSSEPRDKIYAVLNLAQDGDKIVPKPDYSLSIRQIYIQLVVSMVQETGRLDVLSLAGLPVYPRILDINLPTWAPDWTYRVTSTINSSIGDVKPVWADRNSHAVVAFHNDSNIMKACGLIVDTVDGLAQSIAVSDHGTSTDCLHQSTSRSNPYIGWGAVDAIWRSLVADLIPSGQRNSYEALSLFLRQCRSSSFITTPLLKPFTFTNWYKLNKSLVVAGRTIEDWGNDRSIPWTDGGLEPEGNETDLFHYRLASHWQSRRFLTTMKGYAGLGPLTSRPGDKICVILGCCTPVLLREIDGHFEVVGECYLHGIMHGEAMIDFDAGKYELKDFEIW